MKNYLSPDGFDALRTELKALLYDERPKVVSAVNAAAALGDRSENAEYIFGKKRLREIDRRIRFLQKRLEDVEIVDSSQLSVEKVSFGLWVSVEDETGRRSHYQIVGQDEINPSQGRITFTSPVGRALLGKRVGDTILVHRPAGAVELEVVAISREKPGNEK